MYRVIPFRPLVVERIAFGRRGLELPDCQAIANVRNNVKPLFFQFGRCTWSERSHFTWFWEIDLYRYQINSCKPYYILYVHWNLKAPNTPTGLGLAPRATRYPEPSYQSCEKSPGSSVCWKQKNNSSALLPITHFLPWQMLDRWQKIGTSCKRLKRWKTYLCNALHIFACWDSVFIVHASSLSNPKQDLTEIATRRSINFQI